MHVDYFTFAYGIRTTNFKQLIVASYHFHSQVLNTFDCFTILVSMVSVQLVKFYLDQIFAWARFVHDRLIGFFKYTVRSNHTVTWLETTFLTPRVFTLILRCSDVLVLLKVVVLCFGYFIKKYIIWWCFLVFRFCFGVCFTGQMYTYHKWMSTWHA